MYSDESSRIFYEQNVKEIKEMVVILTPANLVMATRAFPSYYEGILNELLSRLNGKYLFIEPKVFSVVADNYSKTNVSAKLEYSWVYFHKLLQVFWDFYVKNRERTTDEFLTIKLRAIFILNLYLIVPEFFIHIDMNDYLSWLRSKHYF